MRSGHVATPAQSDLFFSRLASTVIDDPLSALCPLVQHGFPKDVKLFEALAARLVPLQRAVWLLRVLYLTNSTRAPLLCDSAVKALLARLSAPTPAAAAAAAADASDLPRTVYLIRMIEWIVAERLLDDKILVQNFLAELESAGNAPRKAAVLCYLLQPLLIRLVRLQVSGGGAQPSGDSQFVASMVERLQALHGAQLLAGPLARGLRALLRTLLLTHSSFASPMLADPARRVLLHQFCAAPQQSAGVPSVSAPPTLDGGLLRTYSAAWTAGALELKSSVAAAALAADEQARELQATDCVILPSSVLSAAIVDRIPMWLDAFAGAVRIRKQLAPLAAATHLGERRFAVSVRRALEWAVTPMRGGRDRPFVAAVAVDAVLDLAGVQMRTAPRTATAPRWVFDEVLRFVDDCVRYGSPFADFDALVRLLGELVRRRVLSYQTYTRTLISRGFAPLLPNQTLADAMLTRRGYGSQIDDGNDGSNNGHGSVVDDDDDDDGDGDGMAELAQAATLDAVYWAAEMAAAAVPMRQQAKDACVLARHAFIVRQTPILDRAGDDDGVRSDRKSRAMLLTRKSLDENAADHANELVGTFLSAAAVEREPPTSSSLLARLALHEQTLVAKETANSCAQLWTTLAPARLAWAVALIERVGCAVTLVDALLLFAQQCAKLSALEAQLLEILKRHEAAFVWCDRALDLRNVLARQPRYRTMLEAFQHRFEGALPSSEHHASMKGSRKPTKHGAAGTIALLQMPELPRAHAACLAVADGTKPASASAALGALVGGLTDALLPPPALATECAVLAARNDGSGAPDAERTASLRAAVRSGAFMRLLSLAPSDVLRGAVAAQNDESGDGAVLSADASAFVDSHVFTTPLLTNSSGVGWSVALLRGVLVCVLRATPWNAAANASVLRACCDAAGNDAAFVESLPHALPPQNVTISSAMGRIYRAVARAALAAGVMSTRAYLRADSGGASDSAAAVWSQMRQLMAHTGGPALLGALVRESLAVLNEDSLIQYTPYQLPNALMALLGESVSVPAGDAAAAVALHDAVASGLVRLLVPAIRELRWSTAPGSLLHHMCVTLAHQLRKWHSVTTSHIDAIAATDEMLRGLQSALVVRVELVIATIQAVRTSHANCARDCVCDWQALFDVLTDIATNGVARVGAADDDTLMLLCVGALRYLTDRVALPQLRTERLHGALQRSEAVPAFSDAEEVANDEQRKPPAPWSLAEGLAPLQSVFGSNSVTVHARAPPRYANVVSLNGSGDDDSRAAISKRALPDESAWKRSRRS
jgi:hypothetical protein